MMRWLKSANYYASHHTRHYTGSNRKTNRSGYKVDKIMSFAFYIQIQISGESCVSVMQILFYYKRYIDTIIRQILDQEWLVF